MDYPDSRDARLIPHPFCILDEWRRAVCCLQQHYNHINKPTKTCRYVPSNGRFPDINPVISSHVETVTEHYEEIDSKYKAIIPLKNVYIPVQLDAEDFIVTKVIQGTFWKVF